jgi:hypothetical protein
VALSALREPGRAPRRPGSRFENIALTQRDGDTEMGARLPRAEFVAKGGARAAGTYRAVWRLAAGGQPIEPTRWK